MAPPPKLTDQARKAMEEIKLRSNQIAKLEAQRSAALLPLDTSIAAEKTRINELENVVKQWANDSLPQGAKLTHYGVRVVNQKGKPKVVLKDGVKESDIAQEVAALFPLLTTQVTELNRRAILDRAKEEDDTARGEMAALRKLGLKVEQVTEVKVTLAK